MQSQTVAIVLDSDLLDVMYLSCLNHYTTELLVFLALYFYVRFLCVLHLLVFLVGYMERKDKLTYANYIAWCEILKCVRL